MESLLFTQVSEFAVMDLSLGSMGKMGSEVVKFFVEYRFL